MDLRSFYAALLPASGAYALFSVPENRHVWADSLDDLVARTVQRQDQHSWYFAVGSFNEHTRKQANVLAKRAFYLDIDAGPEKVAAIEQRIADGKAPESARNTVYLTQREALAAVVQFSKDSGLAPSFIVSSGAGLHIYYALDADVTAEAWAPVAERLKNVCRLRGLRADPTSTCDSARILRPVGALHRNGNRVTVLKATGKTWSLAAFAALLRVEEPAPARRFEPKHDINDDVLGDFRGPPVSALKIAEKCAALKEVADARGDCVEPHWRAMIGLVKHCVEGAEQAHNWSNGYAGYSFDETQEKFDRYEAGPTTCSKFEEYTDACLACPHRGKIKSPITLGRLTVQQEAKLPPEQRPAEPPPPAPPKDTGIPDVLGQDFQLAVIDGMKAIRYRRVVEKEGDEGIERSVMWPVLTYTPFWFDEWVDADEGDDEVATSMLVRLVDGAQKRNKFDDSNVVDIRSLLKELAKRNIRCAVHDLPTKTAMQTYVNQQLQRIRANRSRPILRDRFGFHFDKAGAFSAAQGQFVIRRDGTIHRAILGTGMEVNAGLGHIAVLAQDAGHSWPKSVWQDRIVPAAAKQAAFYRTWYGGNDFAVAQLTIMMHLAAPMMCFTHNSVMTPGAPLPPVGATVSLFSANSGRGKTTAMQAGAAAFGIPEELVHRGSKGGITRVAASARAAAVGTGAFDLDEVTRDTAEDAAELIDNIASGTDKMRGNQRGKIARAPATFSVIGFVSTNMPQRDLLASVQTNSDALQQRLVELNFDAQPEIQGERFKAYQAAYPVDMAPYIGALGAVIHLHCVTAGPQKMHERMNALMAEAITLLGATAKERFVVRLMACMLAAHEVLSRYKLCPFELDSLVAQFKAAVDVGRTQSTAATMTGMDQARKMLADLTPHFISTAGESVNGDRGDVLDNAHNLRQPVLGRQVRTGRYTYLSVDAAKVWCKQNGVSFSQLLGEVRTKGAVIPQNGKDFDMVLLTRGITGLAQVRMPCIKFNDVALYGAEEVAGNVTDIRREPAARADARKEAV